MNYWQQQQRCFYNNPNFNDAYRQPQQQFYCPQFFQQFDEFNNKYNKPYFSRNRKFSNEGYKKKSKKADYTQSSLTVQLTRIYKGADGQRQKLTLQQEFENETELQNFLKMFENKFAKRKHKKHSENDQKSNCSSNEPSYVVVEEPEEETQRTYSPTSYAASYETSSPDHYNKNKRHRRRNSQQQQQQANYCHMKHQSTTSTSSLPNRNPDILKYFNRRNGKVFQYNIYEDPYEYVSYDKRRKSQNPLSLHEYAYLCQALDRPRLNSQFNSNINQSCYSRGNRMYSRSGDMRSNIFDYRIPYMQQRYQGCVY